jgi:hypothetical protein
MLRFADGRSFACGVCAFYDRHLKDSSTLPRIVLSIAVGRLRVAAIVDTGEAYFICAPELAQALDLSRYESLGTNDLIIRGIKYRGDLYRVDIQFLADAGTSLDLAVTAFVPRLLPGEEWHFPSFLGLQGCLEFLRFAVDPASNTFFFGPLI